MANKQSPVKPAQKRAPKKNRRKKPARTWAQRFALLKRPAAAMAGIGVLCLVSAGFIGGYKLITECHHLRISHIDVQGVCMMTPDEVIAKAGIRYGDNIMAVNLSQVRRRLMAEPWIIDAEVMRTLPSDLAIRIQERSPLAVVDFGECYFVGQDGQVFKKLDRPAGEFDLPVIKGLTYCDIDVGGRATGKAFCAAVQALKTADRVAHLIDGMKIQTVSVDRDTGITLDGFQDVQSVVRMGYGDYFDKFRRLKDILWRTDQQDRRHRIAAVGLENPDRVVVKVTEYEGTQKGGEHAGSGYSRRS